LTAGTAHAGLEGDRIMTPGRSADKRPFARLAVRALAAAALLVPAAVLLERMPAHADQAAGRLPDPALDVPATATDTQTATFSGGCFWGVQGVFEHVRGVKRVLSGYAGGKAGTADYSLVSTGMTGHAESVQITYDPQQVSYGRLMQILFSVAMDPTELNYQGPDHGSQYRSEIWAANDDQRRTASAYIAQLGQAKSFPSPIVTRVDEFAGFYPAEAYHQDFLERHPDHPYIRAWDMPKVEALRRLFPESYTATPSLAQGPGAGS
jgi:peptide-methionine (S)-S-oxide reductase